jgi:hypothetical protein
MRSVGLLMVLMLTLAQAASAHSGEGISMEHVLIEIGTWALAVTAVIAVIVGVFWVRARASRR